MIKNVKKVIFASMLIISYILITTMPTLAADNSLKAGYGFSSLNLAPRATVNKNYTRKKGESADNYFDIGVKDDNKLKIFTDTLVWSTGTKYQSTYCLIPGCTNKKHYHRTDKGTVKTGITNTKKEEILRKLWTGGDGVYFTKDQYGSDTAKETFIATDFDGLSSKTTFTSKVKNNKITHNSSMRVNYSYTNGNINFILNDNNGIATNKAYLKIIDQNSHKTLKILNAKKLAKELKSVSKDSSGKIIKGIYSLPISKFTAKNGTYFVKVVTTEASGLAGYDMAKFKIPAPVTNSNTSNASNNTTNTSASVAPKVPTLTKINREVRFEPDTTNKNQFKLNFKDCGGISSIKVTAYTSKNKKLNSYTISGAQINSNKKLNDFMQYKAYNANTDIASLVVNKSYFTKKSNKKDNKINFEIEATDKYGLVGKEKIYVTYSKNGWKVNRGARTTVDYSNGIVKLTMKDYDGIAVGKANLQVKDKNNKNTVVVDATYANLSNSLTDIKKKGNTIVEGTFKLDINKLKKNSNNEYKLWIKSTDGYGHSRVENVILNMK